MTRRQDALSGASLLSCTAVIKRTPNFTALRTASQDVKLWNAKLHFLSYCPRSCHYVLYAARRTNALPLDVGEANASPRCVLTRFSCDSELLRCRNVNLFALSLILRFTRRMTPAVKSGSKLCADNPRHTQVRQPSAACLRSTWQEEGRALPVASPPVCRTRHAETVPVSTPSGLRAASGSRSWVVHP
jgi:hypothetical protein